MLEGDGKRSKALRMIPVEADGGHMESMSFSALTRFKSLYTIRHENLDD
jgi:hypothetical protein